MIFCLSPGNAHDGPEGLKLIGMLGELLVPGCKLLMYKAYCGAAAGARWRREDGMAC